MLAHIGAANFGDPAHGAVSGFQVQKEGMKAVLICYQQHLKLILSGNKDEAKLNKLNNLLDSRESTERKTTIDVEQRYQELQQQIHLAKLKNKAQRKPVEEHPPLGQPRQPLIVSASSAGFSDGNYATITLNNKAVELARNTQGHDRGLHIVTINTTSCQVDSAKVFDTYKASDELDEFISKGIPIGRIVVAACKDDCVTSLSDRAKQWFADMGSKEIWKL